MKIRLDRLNGVALIDHLYSLFYHHFYLTINPSHCLTSRHCDHHCYCHYCYVTSCTITVTISTVILRKYMRLPRIYLVRFPAMIQTDVCNNVIFPRFLFPRRLSPLYILVLFHYLYPTTDFDTIPPMYDHTGTELFRFR